MKIFKNLNITLDSVQVKKFYIIHCFKFKFSFVIFISNLNLFCQADGILLFYGKNSVSKSNLKNLNRILAIFDYFTHRYIVLNIHNKQIYHLKYILTVFVS